MKIKFAWYDLWVGVYIDRTNRRVYICPLPMLVILLDFSAARRRQHGLLLLLETERLTTGELQTFYARMWGEQISGAVLRSELTRLERRALIKRDTDTVPWGDRRVFAITAKGKAVIAAAAHVDLRGARS